VHKIENFDRLKQTGEGRRRRMKIICRKIMKNSFRVFLSGVLTGRNSLPMVSH